MDFDAAIDFNRHALMRVVGMLVAAVGPVSGNAAIALPRHLRYRLMRLLRPAESAARRLILIAARGVTVALKPVRVRAKPKPQKPEWLRGGPIRSGLQIRLEAEAKAAAKAAAARARIPAFPLYDKRKHFALMPPRRYAKHCPRISAPGYDDIPRNPQPAPRTPDDLVDSVGMYRRMQSLQRALGDVPAQAVRLARMQERRGNPLRGPMRPGRPPGHRNRRKHDVDKVLADCHAMAIGTWEPDDTS